MLRHDCVSAHGMIVSCPQSYTALQCWRDLSGDKFDIARLPMALKECGHHDLGDSANLILNSRCMVLLVVLHILHKLV